MPGRDCSTIDGADVLANVPAGRDRAEAKAQGVSNGVSKWKPEEEKGLTIHAFVSDLAGRGGFILVETNDPKAITAFAAKYNYWNDVKITPVLDVGEVVPTSASALDWARKASKG